MSGTGLQAKEYKGSRIEYPAHASREPRGPRRSGRRKESATPSSTLGREFVRVLVRVLGHALGHAGESPGAFGRDVTGGGPGVPITPGSLRASVIRSGSRLRGSEVARGPQGDVMRCTSMCGTVAVVAVM